MEIKSVSIPINYGRVRVNIKDLMDQKGITRGALSRLSNVRFEVTTKWYNGEVERIDTDILARFCYILECDISDILVYEK